jgi:ubiquinone/menaquinone biosynthesis C-methylase UbiE
MARLFASGRISGLAVLALPLLIGFAQAEDHHDHPNKNVSGKSVAPYHATTKRRFDNVEYWQKVFDDPKRDEWQKPDATIDALGISPGDRVADLGAGTGYFLPYLVEAVGPSGTVFAVEVEPNLIAHMRERAEQLNAPNIIPILASLDDARLPDQSVDLILIVDTFHHLDDRLAYLSRLKRDLSDRGRIAIVDWKKEELPEGPRPDHKIAPEQVVRELQAAGFRQVPLKMDLPYHYLLLFEPNPREK